MEPSDLADACRVGVVPGRRRAMADPAYDLGVGLGMDADVGVGERVGAGPDPVAASAARLHNGGAAQQ